jgi:osmotically-inducible protein OsmY
MKTDSELKQDVMAELAWDPAIKADAVGVAVKDGVVTLTGHLETFGEKFAIERALRRIQGVQAIALELDVKLSPQHERSDTEIAQAIEQALRWNASVPEEKIRVMVERGGVRLSGEVDWDFQRQATERSIRPLIGVKSIVNEITLKPRATPSDVLERIEEALKRQAEREARRVQVSVSGSTVTLSGTVHSWHERKAAAGAAWSAPGVHSVIDGLRVGA